MTAPRHFARLPSSAPSGVPVRSGGVSGRRGSRAAGDWRAAAEGDVRASDILRAVILRQAGLDRGAGKPSRSADLSGAGSDDLGIAPDQMGDLLPLWWAALCRDLFGGPKLAALALGKCEKTGRNYEAGRGPDAATVAWVLAEVEGARDHLRAWITANARGV
jgi:hypothetical protein